MWRQGDILIQAVEAIPSTVRKLRGALLARGDSTGQRHRLKDRRSAQLYLKPDGRGGEVFLEVTAEQAEIVHPEHATILLGKGRYRVWRQREFDETGARPVRD